MARCFGFCPDKRYTVIRMDEFEELLQPQPETVIDPQSHYLNVRPQFLQFDYDHKWNKTLFNMLDQQARIGLHGVYNLLYHYHEQFALFFTTQSLRVQLYHIICNVYILHVVPCWDSGRIFYTTIYVNMCGDDFYGKYVSSDPSVLGFQKFLNYIEHSNHQPRSKDDPLRPIQMSNSTDHSQDQ
jgi:hypothetical protein